MKRARAPLAVYGTLCLFTLAVAVARNTNPIATPPWLDLPLWLGHPLSLVGGILLAMIAYQKLTKWVITKFNLTDKLDPLFTSRHRKKTLRD